VAPVNGCGPQTSFVSGALNTVVKSLKPTFVSCCNTHDRCYADCNKSQNTCDLEFKNCLLSKCSSIAFHCQLAANAMYQAVNLFGKSAYEDGQRKGCYCAKPTPEEMASINNKIQDVLKKFTSLFTNGMEEEEEEMVENDVEGSEDDVGALEYNIEASEDDVNALGYDVGTLGYDVEDLSSF